MSEKLESKNSICEGYFVQKGVRLESCTSMFLMVQHTGSFLLAFGMDNINKPRYNTAHGIRFYELCPT